MEVQDSNAGTQVMNKDAGQQRRARRWMTRSNMIAVVVILTGALLFLTMAPFKFNGTAMEPTIGDEQYIMAYKFAYTFGEPQRGDIVVHQYPSRPAMRFAHRVIGLPGERVAIRDGSVYINESVLEEPYLGGVETVCTAAQACSRGPMQVPEGHILVLGDNRANSLDSRDYGAVSPERVIGQVWLRYYPFTYFGTFEQPVYRMRASAE